jgi:cytochrome c-type biogenesis protein CcmH
MIVAGGKATPEAIRDFEEATALDPVNVMARYYLGVAAAQAGDRDKAIGLFEALGANAPSDAPWLRLVKSQLAALRGEAAPPETPSADAPPPMAGGGPDSEQGRAIAAMPAQERSGMIRSMVERLATRLEANGDDVEGWLKLIRAYSVLAEPDKVKKAIADAHRALAAKQGESARIDALAKELGVGG